MPAQPTSSSQNTGLVIIVVGIFMVIIAFLAVTYLNSDQIRDNQDKNSQRSQIERSDLTKLTCALWEDLAKDKASDPKTVEDLSAICAKDS